MADFEGSPTALVADVDCTTDGKDLCEKHGVRGYPTIKHGDPNNLQDYDGARDYDGLKAFADENLGPSCGPENLDLCDAEKKTLVEKFMKMSSDRITGKIKKAEKDIKKLEEDFEATLKGLQSSYEKAEKDKEAGLKEIKESGLGLMKAVKAFKDAGGKSEL